MFDKNYNLHYKRQVQETFNVIINETVIQNSKHQPSCKMCSAISQKYAVPTLSPPPLLGSNGLKYNYITSPSNKQSYMSVQAIALTFSVLLCVCSCLLTISLSYKWDMDNNSQIEQLEIKVREVIQDLNTFANIVRKELAVKHVNNNINTEENKNENHANDYEDLEEDYGTANDKFMGKELSNDWPIMSTQANESQNSKSRQRRKAEIDATNVVKNKLNSSIDGKSNVEFIQQSIDENTLRTFDQRKPKKMASKIKTAEVESEENYEDFIETSDVVAAHFQSDSSKYNTKIHSHYRGNGLLKHPNGEFNDWTQYVWDTNNNNHNFLLKNGKVEILKSGMYFVYAQIFYSDQHDYNGYYIMKNEEKIVGCITTRHQYNQSGSCYTGSLRYFNSKDTISIKGLDSERFIILDPTKTFFGLFKVPKDTVK